MHASFRGHFFFIGRQPVSHDRITRNGQIYQRYCAYPDAIVPTYRRVSKTFNYYIYRFFVSVDNESSDSRVSSCATRNPCSLAVQARDIIVFFFSFLVDVDAFETHLASQQASKLIEHDARCNHRPNLLKR